MHVSLEIENDVLYNKFELTSDPTLVIFTLSITDIMNASLRSSEVPTSMKSAVVTPLPQATLEPEVLKHYRTMLFLIYLLHLEILIRKHGLELHAYAVDTHF